ncbi:hypothetical protein GALMADRAFT_250076 [Galerina marginata CBS 339.88]|uniref:Uncharacterized protein n=1 Tax=Galerina marginata (strain CBS 339.88) TaxID=685588 RepID=A0A067T2W3_GALM3|nr:hypothetical protein GALMADRAFT_250076 [Galerina marginata CBS 339.88]
MPYLAFEILPPTQKTASSSYGFVKSDPNVKGSPSNPNSYTVNENCMIKHPVVKLEVDKITDATAGRLATSLLGHVLFLKNQVPFPVTQLGRIPGGKSTARAAKQRAELLASFDTVSSHLDTTFTALSTALARCSDGSNSKVAQAHLAILIGPSLGSAKSKVILGIDGLEPGVWGRTKDISSAKQQKDEDSDEGDGHSAGEDIESSDGDEEGPEDSDEEYEDEEEEEGEEEDDDEEDEEEETYTDDDRLSSPPPYISHAEEQKFLQHADRLLSRTLAAADAEGNGITSELAPTQTHILIRAPRRFSHPAWIPRQTVTPSLESSLQDFMNTSGLGSPDVEADTNIKHTKRSTVEGVWITTQGGLRCVQDANPATNLEGADRTEDDEMIWWSWDGKFVGFADW